MVTLRTRAVSPTLEGRIRGEYDPWDSAAQDFDERMAPGPHGPIYDYKFQRDICDGNPSIKDPVSWKRRWDDINRRVNRRFPRLHLSPGYSRSELVKEKYRILDEKILRLYTRVQNRKVNMEIAKLFRNFNISRYAHDKAQYISRRVSELSNEAGRLGSYEIAMYKAGPRPRDSPAGFAIDEIYLPNNQRVSDFNCIVNTACHRDIFRDIRSDGRTFYGWTHSHGSHYNHFSPTDEPSVDLYLQRFGITTPLKNLSLWDHGERHYLRTTFSIVMNRNCDRPVYRITIMKPRFYLVGKSFRVTHEKIVLENSDEADHRRAVWPVPEIFDDGRVFDQAARRAADREIINAVRYNDHARLYDLHPLGRALERTRGSIKSGIDAAVDSLRHRYRRIKDGLRDRLYLPMPDPLFTTA